WAFVRFVLSRFMLLYGRRRFAVTLLAGFLFAAAAESVLVRFPGLGAEFRTIGHLIPGLLAAEMLAEGPLPTAAVALGGAAVVRLILAALGAAVL
ncbi:MAG: hypothetical protein JNG85_00440, partial [Spirochaetaceae bacterium]|nr:hypothetical protein [Spirochaetaceae bacterium]